MGRTGRSILEGSKRRVGLEETDPGRPGTVLVGWTLPKELFGIVGEVNVVAAVRARFPVDGGSIAHPVAGWTAKQGRDVGTGRAAISRIFFLEPDIVGRIEVKLPDRPGPVVRLPEMDPSQGVAAVPDRQVTERIHVRGVHPSREARLARRTDRARTVGVLERDAVGCDAF